MNTLRFRFDHELNDFLPPPRRNQPFDVAYPTRASVKDLIESLGVPHPEVAAILINGSDARFTTIPHSGNLIEVYPATTAPSHVQPPHHDPPPAPYFVLDVHLGRLAEYLRLLGFDTLYRNDYDDEELAAIADEQRRILLSRDLGLLKRGRVRYGRYVRATDPQRQVREIVQRWQLIDQIEPFRRCTRCNGLLQPVDKTAIADRVPPLTRQHYDSFHQCAQCGQIYWPGSHYARLQQFVAQLRADAADPHTI